MTDYAPMMSVVYPEEILDRFRDLVGHIDSENEKHRRVLSSVELGSIDFLSFVQTATPPVINQFVSLDELTEEDGITAIPSEALQKLVTSRQSQLEQAKHFEDNAYNLLKDAAAVWAEQHPEYFEADGALLKYRTNTDSKYVAAGHDAILEHLKRDAQAKKMFCIDWDSYFADPPTPEELGLEQPK